VQFRKDPEQDSLSLEPSDGGSNWCECQECAELGTVSDRVVMLADEVAEAVNEGFENKYIGIYAYSSHPSPPNVQVHPNVIVSIATAYIKGGYTLDELLRGWDGTVPYGLVDVSTLDLDPETGDALPGQIERTASVYG
jgi:hypothetical protein